MKGILSCLFIIFSSIQFVQAQNTGSIKGAISTSDKQPAVSVTITLKGTNKSTLSDNKGNFVLNKVEPGNYQLVVSLVGHSSVEQAVTVAANQASTVSVELQATGTELQEVMVVSPATKFAKKQSDYVARLPISNLENPQVYTVVPKELIQEQMAVDFRSAITAAPGLSNVTQSVGSGGVGLAIRMRGFSGASAAGSIRNGMNTNWVTMSDPVNLERIEVIKGPSATLFGSALITYGGLINRVTKRPFDFFKGEVSYSTGSWALSRTTIDINTPLNKEKNMLFRVNAVLDNQKTWQDYGRSSTTVITPAFTYKVNEKLTLDFELELYNGKRNATYIGLGSPGPKTAKSFDDLGFDFKRSYTTDDFLSYAKTTNAFARATYKLSDKWVSQTNFSNSFTDNNANYLFLLINTDSTMQRRLMQINSVFKTTQLQQNFIGDFKIGSLRNRLLLGVDYNYISTNDNRWIINYYDTVKINKPAAFINQEKYNQKIAAMPAPSVTNNRDLRTLSFYVSDVVNITDKLIAMASVRIDKFNDKLADYEQTAVSPKMGLVYQLLSNKVSLFANYMNGFTNVAPGTTSANPSAKTAFEPEHANQLEGGVKLELLEGKLNGTLSYYDITVDNKVRPDPNNPTFSVQDGTQSSKGFEADLIATPAKGLHLIFGYGHNTSMYTKAAANIEGKRPASTPADVANFWISYKLQTGKIKGLGLGFGGNYQSDSYLNDANTFTADGYTKLDATIYYEVPKVRIGLKLNNITDVSYWSADFWANMMPKRQLIASLAFRF